MYDSRDRRITDKQPDRRADRTDIQTEKPTDCMTIETDKQTDSKQTDRQMVHNKHLQG